MKTVQIDSVFDSTFIFAMKELFDTVIWCNANHCNLKILNWDGKGEGKSMEFGESTKLQNQFSTLDETYCNEKVEDTCTQFIIHNHQASLQ